MTQETVSKKPLVLFTCTGHTARSQMAQVLLKQPAPDRKIQDRLRALA